MRALLLVCAFFACNTFLGGALAQMFSGIVSTYCSRQNNGQNYCWGAGWTGQLGNGLSAGSPFPVKMLNVDNATHVSAGESHTAIVDQGKARCTGRGDLLGRSSSSAESNTLVDVEGVDYSVDTVKQVFAGYEHSCLVTATGGAKCWGRNSKGQLGNSAAVQYYQAFPVTGFETSGVVTMSLGFEHTSLLNTMGKVYCVGSNSQGELGRGGSSSGVNALMQPIVGEEIMVSISCGYYHSCAVSSTGTLYCWGHGQYGQLGQGNTAALYVFSCSLQN